MVTKYLKKSINRLGETAGIKIKRIKYLPWGEDMYVDIQRLINKNTFKVVFDVGANVGQSCQTYLEQFPNANIYSFEPVAATYSKLADRFSKNSRVTTIHAALGQQIGKSTIILQGSSTLNSLNPARNISDSQNPGIQEEIRIETLDNFCKQNNIDTIDFIKIDTEGYEKEVLSGASEQLKAGKIKFMLLELGIKKMPRTTFYNEVHDQLSGLGFEVIAFYRQSQSLYTKERFVMHCDVLFINQQWSAELNPAFVKKLKPAH